jgi:hypothetical protein
VGSVLDRNLEKDILTEEKLDDIGTGLEASPKKLLYLLALQCGLAEYTAHIGTKFLKLDLTKLQSYIAFCLQIAK